MKTFFKALRINIMLLAAPLAVWAQPCSLPGMTPATAIPVCGTQVFTQNTVVTCSGQNLANNFCTGVPITTDNSFWYKFTCYTSGTLQFVITPQGSSTDFDWELLDVTGRPLNDIYGDPSLMVSVNLSGNFGATGCNNTGITNINCAGNVSRFNRLANLVAGHNYLLQIANWSNSGTGYTLDFTGGTAVITDLTPSIIDNVVTTCDQDEITVNLSKDIKCSSLSGGSEFIVQPGNIPVSSVLSSCNSGTFSANSLQLNFASLLAPGNYTLEVKLGNDGNTLLDACNNPTPVGTSAPFTIKAPPVANFTTTGPFCAGSNITFTDASIPVSGTILSYNWDMGDGTTFTKTTSDPFTYSYATDGTYNVVLFVVSSSGCISPGVGRQVVVKPVPVPGFTHTPACLPNGLVNFTNTTTISNGAALNYVWDFGDPASGVNNTSNGVSPSHFYATPSPFSVKLTANSADGCSKVITLFINDVYEQADAAFTLAAPENCFGLPTSLTSTSNPLAGNAVSNWFWDMGNGTVLTGTSVAQSYIYPATGTYTIKHWIKTSTGCNSDTVERTVVINALPAANFTNSTPLCANRTINFTDASAANSGILTSWAWNFGDGVTDNTANPSHTYTASGTYTVSLVVTNSKTCVSAVFTRNITIAHTPVANFLTPEICLTDTYAEFTDLSTVAGGTITNWLWNFGDPGSGVNNTATIQNARHSYTAVGIYNVTLTVTTNAGCQHTITLPITINGDVPVANFNAVNPATLCANDFVSIQDASTVNFGSITRVEIYWDNVGAPGVFEIDENPTPDKVYQHLYPNFQSPLTRTFSIRYRAYSGISCVNDRIKNITVNAAPKVQFGLIPVQCADGLLYQIVAASEVGGVPGSGVYSGPGTTPGGQFNPGAVGPGTYVITYTFTSTAGGCIDKQTSTVTVLEPALPNFTVTRPICEKATINFTDISTIPVASGTIVNRIWNFGDGSPLVTFTDGTTPVSHTYTAWGNYVVTLYVTTSNSCISAVKTMNIRVNPLPKPNFTVPASLCIPNAYANFINTSTIEDGTANALTYLWNFGDPASGSANTSTSKNATHYYSAVGPYTVGLRAVSDSGCIKDTAIIFDNIHPQPKADFSFSKPSVCIGDAVTMTDESDGLDGTVDQWFWKLGDGTVRSISSFSYTYGTEQTFDVSLYIINSQGCNSDTLTQPFTVHPYPVVNAGPDRLVLEGDQAMLQPIVSGNDLQYLWTPNLYFVSSNTLAQPIIKGVEDITYTVTVTARGGCKASDAMFVKVLRFPQIPNTFTPNNDGINDFWDIKFLSDYPDGRVQVFNRTGQLVYESRRYILPWNGTMKGKPLPFDTYYYIIEPGNSRKPLTGFVTIVK